MFPVVPLLHATQGAVATAPVVAAWLMPAFIVSAAGGGLAAWITRLLPLPRLRARARRRLVIFAGSALTMLAVLPSVIAYDHLLPRDAHAGQSAAVHAAHCHDAPGSCADAPVTSGPGQMLNAAPLVVPPAMLSILLLAITPILIGVTRRPYLRPPLLLVVASI